MTPEEGQAIFNAMFQTPFSCYLIGVFIGFLVKIITKGA